MAGKASVKSTSLSSASPDCTASCATSQFVTQTHKQRQLHCPGHFPRSKAEAGLIQRTGYRKEGNDKYDPVTQLLDHCPEEPGVSQSLKINNNRHRCQNNHLSFPYVKTYPSSRVFSVHSSLRKPYTYPDLSIKFSGYLCCKDKFHFLRGEQGHGVLMSLVKVRKTIKVCLFPT